MSDPTHIVVRNARTHNLRGVDLAVPRNALVVFTGVSGSGKSSLVFDTIFQEGQRRFLESLSAYARQFLGHLERPDVDAVDGISPTLSIDQKTVNRNPRSTVGTVTEIHDHLRLLMARLGEPRCPLCATPIARLGLTQIADEVIHLAAGRTTLVLGPVVQERKGEYRKEIEDLQRDGWVRARIDGEVVRLDAAPELERYKQHTIEVVVDRLVPSDAERGRLHEAIETALRLGQQTCRFLIDDAVHAFSTNRACPNHPEQALPELEPRLFSFNNPQGACPACDGLGELQRFEPARLVEPTRPIATCLRCLTADGKVPFSRIDSASLPAVARLLGVDPATPFHAWTDDQQRRFLDGDPTRVWRTERDGEARAEPWPGVIPVLDKVWYYTQLPSLAAFRSALPCPDCQGARLHPMARSVVFRERRIHELGGLSVRDAHAFFTEVTLTADEAPIGELLLAEIRERLTFLVEVGLGYLTLSRSAATLSGGEAQRIRLASQVGSGLQGVTYVLDEPSIGLHPRDNQRLLHAIRRLRDRGNSVLVVEHDAETILAADHVVDVGPGAGRLGGHVTAEGPPGRFLQADTLTAAWLRGERAWPVPGPRVDETRALRVRDARANNLTGVTVDFPLARLTVVTGVSGSGKSSLVFHVLEASVERMLDGGSPVACAGVDGIAAVDKLVRISQRPIGRTPRSNPATYTGAMDLIRDLFAELPESKARGYTKGRFSFNVAGGRCEACEGAGVKTIEMQFLPDVEVPCETCDGRRFNAETLEIRWRGRTIADVLDLTIGEALEVFARQPKLARIFQTLHDVGLDYVTLGQTSTTLSGGEAQRVKLATELYRPATGHTLYLLDEPTTGLHFEDVAKLLTALDRLVSQGNTVIVVEHHTDVIRFADHLIDLGPEGGDAGGRVVGEGPPDVIARLDTPTGRALAAAAVAPAAVGEPPAAVYRPDAIVVEGARKHNLQGVSARIPHGQLTVVTGPSGSGKTSFAFDTVFAEGQRRYVESLSTYARRFLGRLDRAPVDRLEGLQPAIAIDQTHASHNPRSTVATVTEIHDVLRVLYARMGQPHCPTCGLALIAWSPTAIARALADAGPGWMTTPLPPDADRDALVRDGWARLLDGDTQVELDHPDAPALLRRGAALVVDRLTPGTDPARTAEAATRAFQLGGRAVWTPRQGARRVFLPTADCPDHGAVVPALTPKHFSFNSRLGMCGTCEGLGQIREVTAEPLMGGDAPVRLSIDPRVQAIMNRSARWWPLVDALFAAHGVPVDVRQSAWPPALRAELLGGRPTPLTVTTTTRMGGAVRTRTEQLVWPGLLHLARDKASGIPWVTRDVVCPTCRGGRLAPALLAVTLGGIGIHALSQLPVDEALTVVDAWDFAGEQAAIAERPLLELRRRLTFLRDVGLGYLTLDRAAETLSGGESQRIRLASQLGSGLTGVTYVLDEPTVGLHPRDTGRLLDTLAGLRDLGNTVLVVEHDPETIERADHVLDLGPGAGSFGGRLVASGTPAEVRADPRSVTGPWLSGARAMPPRPAHRAPYGAITVTGASGNNLRVDEVRIPLGVWTAVTGVSGSGKSTLIMDTLAPRLTHAARPAPHAGFAVEGPIHGVITVDQTPIGRTPRSTPASYVGLFDKVRALYASLPLSQERGWTPIRFSFNAPGGRCDACEGRGAQLIEMHFLPDVWITCSACRGRRYDAQTLQARYKGLSIADMLDLRCDEALEVLQHQRGMRNTLQALVDVGLGYLRLGQPGNTLSGGEAQRIKLAAELTARGGQRLYILDEPTSGLHLDDVAKLVAVLHQLVGRGNTVITIEHHLDMIRAADHVIELGPEGGAAGGRIVAVGTPEEVARGDTATGVALRREAARRTG